MCLACANLCTVVGAANLLQRPSRLRVAVQIFHINYLGVDQPSLQLNFSKNANMVVAQYYQVR